MNKCVLGEARQTQKYAILHIRFSSNTIRHSNLKLSLQMDQLFIHIVKVKIVFLNKFRSIMIFDLREKDQILHIGVRQPNVYSNSAIVSCYTKPVTLMMR